MLYCLSTAAIVCQGLNYKLYSIFCFCFVECCICTTVCTLDDSVGYTQWNNVILRRNFKQPSFNLSVSYSEIHFGWSATRVKGVP